MKLHVWQPALRYRCLAAGTALTAAALVIPSVAQASVTETAKNSHPATQTAATGLSQCPKYSLCLWQDAGYKGQFWGWSNRGFAHNTWIWVGGSANDNTDSLYNNRDNPSEFAKNYPVLRTDPNWDVVFDGDKIGNLGPLLWEDLSSEAKSISSIKLVS